MKKDVGEKQLGNLASITAAIEATQTEIRSVQIQTGTEVYEAQVQVAVPLNQVTSLDRANIEADHAEFVDSELRFDLVVEVDGVDHSSPETSRNASEGRPEAESPAGDDGNFQETRSERPPRLEDDQNREGGGRKTETPSTVETEPESTSEPDNQRGDDTDTQREVPKYQDPERLAAVYDEDATFEEMRQELGVEVTAQTVRKYMINHGIHEPKPRPDRLLEAIRAAEFELMNSEEDRRPSQAGDSTGTNENE